MPRSPPSCIRYRTGDANMRSVWICSRNDAIGNLAVLLAALGVFGTGTAWPDLVVRRDHGRARPVGRRPDPPPGRASRASDQAPARAGDGALTGLPCRAKLARKERNAMFSHMMVGSNDMARSKTFYNAIFGAIGGAAGDRG